MQRRQEQNNKGEIRKLEEPSGACNALAAKTALGFYNIHSSTVESQENQLGLKRARERNKRKRYSNERIENIERVARMENVKKEIHERNNNSPTMTRSHSWRLAAN